MLAARKRCALCTTWGPLAFTNERIILSQAGELDTFDLYIFNVLAYYSMYSTPKPVVGEWRCRHL